MHKHYIIIVFNREGHYYGYDAVDKDDNELRNLLAKVKSSGIPFTHRLIFTNSTNFQSVIDSNECQYSQITPTKSIDELLSYID